MISEFPLFVFTTLGGIAAGCYVARAVEPLDDNRSRPWLFSAVMLVLLAVGGVALLFHLGQPLRVLNAFGNLGAGITQEGIATVLFGVCVVADLVFCIAKKDSPRWLVVVTAALGAVMMLTMGLAYFALAGTPAWAHVGSVPFFVLGDLAVGAGVYVLFKGGISSSNVFCVYAVAAQVLAALCMIGEGVHFAQTGYAVAPFAVGAVAVLAAAALMLAVRKGKGAAFAYAACVCVVVGVVVARYAFYAASVI